MDQATDTTQRATRSGLAALGIAFALVFPTIITWAYFYRAAAATEGVQQTVMATLKVLQFAFPAVWALLVLGDRIEWRWPSSRGIATGLVFGCATAAAGWLTYQFLLSGSPLFEAAADQIRAKVAGFGIDSVAKYAALGAFYSLAHSLLEEYYWRWFVFGQMRRLLSLGAAITFSAIGFMAHHVLVLSLYFGWWTWPTLLFSAAVAVGGAFWAWLYDRTGSLIGPWLSHLVVDAGIFLIGFEVVRATLG